MPLVLLIAFVGLAGHHTSLVQNDRQISVARVKSARPTTWVI
jgi:hypothetical protein